MTLEQISALAVAGESETLEFKSTTGTRREAASTVCAMLNQRGRGTCCSVSRRREMWRIRNSSRKRNS